MAEITFIEQNAPIDEYGRALYAVARSVLRALLDSLTSDDLSDLNSPLADVTMRQLAKVVRLDRDKGMRGDGFEWAVHEAITGGEPRVTEILDTAMRRVSKNLGGSAPRSLLFGYERAKYLGFLDATVQSAGADPYLLPEGSGRPYSFGKWVSLAAQGKTAEVYLADRIKQIWKTDLFLACQGYERYVAATVKSSYSLLEPGRGLRIGIVPESTEPGHRPGVYYSQKHRLWLATLPDPNGFTGLFTVSLACLTTPTEQSVVLFAHSASKLSLRTIPNPVLRAFEYRSSSKSIQRQRLSISKVHLTRLPSKDSSAPRISW